MIRKRYYMFKGDEGDINNCVSKVSLYYTCNNNK